MKITKRAGIMLLLSAVSLAVVGCAVKPGPYPIQLKYPVEMSKTPTTPAVPMTIGLQEFENISPEEITLGKREVGRAVEIYVSRPNPIAEAVTGAAYTFLQYNAYNLRSVSGWDYKPETLPEVGAGLDAVVSGKIRTLFCTAKKKFARTNMTLDAEVLFIIGDVKGMKVRTKPVKIRLERTDMTFNAQKLQRYMNETLADLLQTGFETIP